jgi:5-methylcytosine-specific restriction endonuclease McrA
VEHKACTHCGAVKPLSGFTPRPSRPSGYQSWCRACVQANARKWIAGRPDRAALYGRRWRDANREQVLAKCKAWNAAHPERIRAKKREWNAANREMVRAQNHARRARAKNARGTATAAQIAARWSMWGGQCYVCGSVATATDHVIPLSRGGTHWPANLRPICKHCNCVKWTKDWRQYIVKERGTPAKMIRSTT